MSYFATLLQRSGVAVGRQGAVAPGGASSAPQMPMAANSLGRGGSVEQPAIREIHEERVLPARDESIERTGARDTHAREHSTAVDFDESIGPQSSSHASGDSSAIRKSGVASRAASFESDDRPDSRSHLAANTPGTSDFSIGAQSRELLDAPMEISELEAPVALESPSSNLETKATSMARALAEVRKWTSQTPLPSELSLIDESLRATTELPAGIRSIEPRPVAARDSTVPELHVSIGSIEVVVEDASPAPQPPARAAKSPPAVSASSSSRRLARHHLRG